MHRSKQLIVRRFFFVSKAVRANAF